jgi:hypothetical protein
MPVYLEFKPRKQKQIRKVGINKNPGKRRRGIGVPLPK